eukprot:scaffold84106_cov75-Phaeocystis_antarctica.AAC.4
MMPELRRSSTLGRRARLWSRSSDSRRRCSCSCPAITRALMPEPGTPRQRGASTESRRLSRAAAAAAAARHPRTRAAPLPAGPWRYPPQRAPRTAGVRPAAGPASRGGATSAASQQPRCCAAPRPAGP